VHREKVWIKSIGVRGGSTDTDSSLLFHIVENEPIYAICNFLLCTTSFHRFFYPEGFRHSYSAVRMWMEKFTKIISIPSEVFIDLFLKQKLKDFRNQKAILIALVHYYWYTAINFVYLASRTIPLTSYQMSPPLAGMPVKILYPFLHKNKTLII